MTKDMSCLLAVNGTLMRGLALEKNLLDVGAVFCREAQTAACYRLWSIRDEYPAMLRVAPGDPAGASIAVEIWSVPAGGVRRDGRADRGRSNARNHLLWWMARLPRRNEKLKAKQKAAGTRPSPFAFIRNHRRTAAEREDGSSHATDCPTRLSVGRRHRPSLRHSKQRRYSKRKPLPVQASCGRSAQTGTG